MHATKTEIIFLMDRSGSMAGLEKETINGFNRFLEKTCHPEEQTLLTAVLFDDESEVLWNGVDALSVQLTDREYVVGGCTALLDAVGKTINQVGSRLAQTPEVERPKKVIFVITTDGEENSSQEFTYEKVKHLIQHQQETYKWEFIFLGANIDAALEASNLGINEDRVYQFEANEKGVEKMYQSVSDMVIEMQLERE